MSLRHASRGLGLAALILAAAAPLAAQSCLGRGVGGLAARAVVGEVARVEYRGAAGSGTDFGAGYWANPGGPLAYSVAYARRFLDGPDPHTARAELAFEVGSPGWLPPGGGACITGGLEGSVYDMPEHDESWRIVSLPVGLALGFVAPVTRTARIYPFVHPRITFTSSTRRHDPQHSLDFGRLLPVDPLVRVVVDAGAGLARGPLVGRLRVGGTLRTVGEARPPIPNLRAALEIGIRF